MTERMLLWFWEKAERYQLSCEAMSLWLDFYSYVQQTDMQLLQLPFEQLQSFSNLDSALFWQVCMELTRAGMMEFVVTTDTLLCQLCSEERFPITRNIAV